MVPYIWTGKRSYRVWLPVWTCISLYLCDISTIQQVVYNCIVHNCATVKEQCTLYKPLYSLGLENASVHPNLGQECITLLVSGHIWRNITGQIISNISMKRITETVLNFLKLILPFFCGRVYVDYTKCAKITKCTHNYCNRKERNGFFVTTVCKGKKPVVVYCNGGNQCSLTNISRMPRKELKNWSTTSLDKTQNMGQIAKLATSAARQGTIATRSHQKHC